MLAAVGRIEFLQALVKPGVLLIGDAAHVMSARSAAWESITRSRMLWWRRICLPTAARKGRVEIEDLAAVQRERSYRCASSRPCKRQFRSN
jgi:hypothetical protein